MMRRLRLLARKEAQQHAWALLALCILLVILGGLCWILVQSDERAPSEMEAARNVVVAFTPFAGLILGHRLVVREYQAKTQLFLEALPLRRWEFVAVKYAFGFCFLMAFNLASLVAVALLAGEATPRFLLLTAARTIGFTFTCWSLFFALGMLGRLRFAAYATLACGALALQSVTSFELAHFGPFELMNSVSFSYDRSHLPLRALLESVSVSVPLVLIALLLALYSEGSWAEALSRRMSLREAVVLGGLIGAELVGVGFATGKREPPPFEFTSPFVVSSERRHTEVMYAFPELEPKARETLSALNALEVRARRDLGLRTLPRLRVAHSNLLDGDEVKHASSLDATLLFEVNLGTRTYGPSKLLVSTLHGALSQASRGRAGFERNHWFLDGISASVASRTETSDGARSQLGALVAARRVRVEASTFIEWERTMERLGETQATALSFALVQYLRRSLGDERVFELARAILARPTVTGAWTYLEFGSDLLQRSLERETQQDFATLCQRFRSDLAGHAAEPELATELGRVPLDSAELSYQRGKHGTEIHYGVTGAVLSRERSCVLLHGLLRPYDTYYPQDQLTREEFVVKAGEARAGGVLGGRYEVGQRVYAAVECSVPELHSRERLLAARLEAR